MGQRRIRRIIRFPNYLRRMPPVVENSLYKAHPQVFNRHNSLLFGIVAAPLFDDDFRYCFNEFDVDARCR